MAHRDGAAVGIDARIVVIEAQQLQAAEHLRGEGLVDFDHVHVGEFQIGARQRLGNGRHRAQAHEARRDAGHRTAHHPRQGLDARALARRTRAEQQGAGAVIDARGITGGDEAVRHQGFQGRELLCRGVGAWMLVLVDDLHSALPAGDFDRLDLAGEELGSRGRRVFALRAEGEAVAVLAADAVFVADVVGGFGERVTAELLVKQGVREARADGRIIHLHVA